jgi:hypothetical protein
MGTTTIRNPGNGRAMGWRWQSVSPGPSRFRWGINGLAASIGMPIETNKLAPGASETLNISFSCPPAGQTYAVVMLDDYNHIYNITLAPK